MFGYINVNKQELKFKEFDRYRSFYCGLCDELKRDNGKSAQFALSYDMTFVIMLLSALYEEDSTEGLVRCIAHPFEKHLTRKNRFTRYAADMNLFLTFEKCADDWKDEKKLFRKCYALLLKKKVKRVERTYPQKVRVILNELARISELEEAGEGNIDLPAGAFGEIMAEIIAYQSDEWENELRRLGFYLGKFVYIMDAWDDLEKDKKTGNYNPLLLRAQAEGSGHIENDVEAMLVMMMGECSRAFERLPIIGGDAEILRNILYSGVWCRYAAIQQKNQTKTSSD